MINEFKYGQTWKIWPSPLSLSLCNPFKNEDLPFNFEERVKCENKSCCYKHAQNLDIIQTVEAKMKR